MKELDRLAKLAKTSKLTEHDMKELDHILKRRIAKKHGIEEK